MGGAVARRVLVLGTGACAALASACLFWAILQTFVRPPDYPEACVLFNAARIRDGLPLWVDPAIGAREYGDPPSRYLVAYTPIAAAMLAALPAAHAIVVGRLFGLTAWCTALVLPVVTAREHRRQALVAATFVGAFFLFARWAADAKPDGIALLLASLALARTVQKERADAWCGLLFGFAALVKPSVVGMGMGALAVSLFVDRRRGWEGAASAILVVALSLVGLEAASGGMALAHLRAALGLAFDTGLFVENVLSRAPFVAGLLAIAGASAWNERDGARGRLASAALLSSSVVAAIGLGKIGAASNYLMEPALASVVILSRCRLRWPKTRAAALALIALAVVSVPWALSATVASLVDEARTFGRDEAALRAIRRRCLDRDRAVVLSTEPGVELALNGRLHTHDVELWNEARRGRFPASVWAADIRSPSVRCFVTWTGDASPPASPVGLHPAEVSRVLREEFTVAGVEGGYAIYARAHPER